jgi:hypothetical protein
VLWLAPDVVMIRRDVVQRVEPLTAGGTHDVHCAVAETRWWIDPAEEIEAADPHERCRVVDACGPPAARLSCVQWSEYADERCPPGVADTAGTTDRAPRRTGC